MTPLPPPPRAVGHTPRPWVVVPPSPLHPSRAMVVAKAGADIYDAPLTEETAANARLIAAAPDIYAALDDLVVACTDVYKQGRISAESFLAARAALTLARPGGERA